MLSSIEDMWLWMSNFYMSKIESKTLLFIVHIRSGKRSCIWHRFKVFRGRDMNLANIRRHSRDCNDSFFSWGSNWLGVPHVVTVKNSLHAREFSYIYSIKGRSCVLSQNTEQLGVSVAYLTQDPICSCMCRITNPRCSTKKKSHKELCTCFTVCWKYQQLSRLVFHYFIFTE